MIEVNQVPAPHPQRLAPGNLHYAEIIRRHDEACRLQREWYDDPETGYRVLTRDFLLNRGTCCNSGCRHCPYIK